MTKSKKISLGVITAVAAIAVPVATVVSCGKKEDVKSQYSNIEYLDHDIQIDKPDLEKDLHLRGFNGEGIIDVPKGEGFTAHVSMTRNLKNYYIGTGVDAGIQEGITPITITYVPWEGYTINGSKDPYIAPSFTIPKNKLPRRKKNFEFNHRKFSTRENNEKFVRVTGESGKGVLDWPFFHGELDSGSFPKYNIEIQYYGMKHPVGGIITSGEIKWWRLWDSHFETRSGGMNNASTLRKALGKADTVLGGLSNGEKIRIIYTPIDSSTVEYTINGGKRFTEEFTINGLTVNYRKLDIDLLVNRSGKYFNEGKFMLRMGETIDEGIVDLGFWTSQRKNVSPDAWGIWSTKLIKAPGSNAREIKIPGYSLIKSYDHLNNGDKIEVEFYVKDGRLFKGPGKDKDKDANGNGYRRITKTYTISGLTKAPKKVVHNYKKGPLPWVGLEGEQLLTGTADQNGRLGTIDVKKLLTQLNVPFTTNKAGEVISVDDWDPLPNGGVGKMKDALAKKWAAYGISAGAIEIHFTDGKDFGGGELDVDKGDVIKGIKIVVKGGHNFGTIKQEYEKIVNWMPKILVKTVPLNQLLFWKKH